MQIAPLCDNIMLASNKDRPAREEPRRGILLGARQPGRIEGRTIGGNTIGDILVPWPWRQSAFGSIVRLEKCAATFDFEAGGSQTRRRESSVLLRVPVVADQRESKATTQIHIIWLSSHTLKGQTSSDHRKRQKDLSSQDERKEGAR